jgi:hypothetical protein
MPKFVRRLWSIINARASRTTNRLGHAAEFPCRSASYPGIMSSLGLILGAIEMGILVTSYVAEHSEAGCSRLISLVSVQCHVRYHAGADLHLRNERLQQGPHRPSRGGGNNCVSWDVIYRMLPLLTNWSRLLETVQLASAQHGHKKNQRRLLMSSL